MKTVTNSHKNFWTQKGQGLIEYALLFGFVGAIALFVMINGGFGHSVENIFYGAGDRLGEANDTSFDYENLTAEDVATPNSTSNSTPNYKTLNWQAIYVSAQAMYGTIMKSDTVDKAFLSETNLFSDLSTMVDNHLASTKAEDGTKDWENFLSMMGAAQTKNNYKSSYKRGEETFTIQRMGNSNAVRATYSDGKEVIYYQLAPDANNVMQIETNSNKSFNEFVSSIGKKGWEYNK